MEAQSIIIFSQCNKSINRSLNPEKNIIINNIFLQSVIKLYFEFDEDYNILNRKNLLGNIRINWKNFLKEITLNFRNYSDKTISNKVKDCFRIHLYLPDLRKEEKELDFESSTSHQIANYEMLFKNKWTYNYYSKFITIDYLKNGLEKGKDIINNKDATSIKILKEGLYFEKELKEFNITFNEFINNNEYKEIINCIVKYDYEKLDFIYKNNYKYNNKQNKQNINIINIINLLLWINHSFILYSNFVYEYINNFIDDTDEKTIIYEFVHKHNDIINCGLLLNSNFENVNIIINHLITFYSIFKDIDENNKNNLLLSRNSSESSTKSSSSSSSNDSEFNNSEKFTLYKLFSIIIKKNVYDKLSELLNNKLKIIINNYSEDLFENYNQNQCEKKKDAKNEICDYNLLSLNENQKMIIDDECNDEDDDEDEDEDGFLDDLSEKEPSEKEIIEEAMNAYVDNEINEKNANVINHSEIVVSNQYKKAEDILIDQIAFNLENQIKREKPCSYLFDIIEKITKVNNNPNILRKDGSLTVIRRTKKSLMEKCIKLLIPNAVQNLIKSFSTHIKLNERKEKVISLTEAEIKNKTEYKCDLSDLSSKKRDKITQIVEEEIKMLKDYLKQKCGPYASPYDKIMTEKVIDEYIDYDGIEDVLLIKRMIWFYYRELGAYEEKNEKIVQILTKKKCLQKYQSINNNFNLLVEKKENKVESKNIIGDLFREEDKKRYQNMEEEELIIELEN